MAPSIHRLDGHATTLLLLEHASGLPEIVHWGSRLPDEIDAAAVADLRSWAIPRSALQGTGPEAVLLPTLGIGLFQGLSFAAHRAGRDWTARFNVDAVEHPKDRLLVRASDREAQLGLEIELMLPSNGDVLTTRCRLTNQSDDEALDVQRLASGVFLLPAAATEVLAFKGRWAREFATERFVLPMGGWSAESRRGRMSHDRFPAMIIGIPAFGEEQGEVFGFHLGWSGNHQIWVELLDDGRRLAGVEALLHPGEMRLRPNEHYETPWAHASFSPCGLTELTRRFHKHVRDHVLRWPDGAMRPRPVIFNTWEGTYFKHDLDKLKRQAEHAARIGVERFVLDDGWFGRRDDDTSSLGDWTVDQRKYPDGLGPLIEHVRALGMDFGLWVEPEMVNPNSELFRAHPDWVLGVSGRPSVLARNQHVLDLTRPEVTDYLFRALDSLLSSHEISYLKWDMNRDLVAAGDAEGRPVYTRYVTALYSLLDRITAAHPKLEIETCASGGGRAEFGILSRTQRIWVSDCTDALERASIQRGFLRFFPPELMGADISGSPNHQTGRRLSLPFRASIALLGHLGVELDLVAPDADQTEDLADWIALHKRIRSFVHSGIVHQVEPHDGRSVCGVVSEDASQAIYVVGQETLRHNRLVPPLVLPGLDPNRSYRLTAPGPQRLDRLRRTSVHDSLSGEGLIVPGCLLVTAGLALPVLPVETALILLVEAP
jgi:alpha-galactosidase